MQVVENRKSHISSISDLYSSFRSYLEISISVKLPSTRFMFQKEAVMVLMEATSVKQQSTSRCQDGEEKMSLVI